LKTARIKIEDRRPKTKDPRPNVKVTIGQINTINGDYEKNVAGIIRAIELG